MRLFIATISTSFILAMAGPAAAEEGMSGLHDKVRVGGKLCFSDHSHSGNSSGERSRKAAETAAIRNWQDFTAWEYGRAWGSYGLAVGKSMQCSGSGASWGCSLEARPCRGGR